MSESPATGARAFHVKPLLGERPLLRHADPAREAGRSRAGLADEEEAGEARPRARRRSAPRPPRPVRARPTGPTQSTTAPPARTSGRHHSTAVGGCASAFATATPAQSVACSSARPQTTRAFAGAQASRNSHLRRSASSSTTSRSGKRVRERDARRAAARADVDDRSVEALDELATARSESSSEHRARLGRGRDRGQAGRRDDGRQPVVKRGRRRRSDSAPSPRSRSRRPRAPSAARARSSARPPSSARAAPARRASARSAPRSAIPSSVGRRRSR